MSLRRKYLKVVSQLVTPGAIGMAVLLGAAAPGVASQEPAGPQPSAVPDERVSDRLAAIREAVSALSEAQTLTTQRAGEHRLAWGNWGGGWGWGGGGGNPFFGAPWNNWNNWRNGWNNWRNGWGNW